MSVIQRPAVDEVREYKMLIGDGWTHAASGKTFESVNPYTGRIRATVAKVGHEDVDTAVRAAREAFEREPGAD